jgi:hypothetical protein
MNLTFKSIAAVAFVACVAWAGQATADGQSCGGSSNKQCPAGQYCKVSADACHTPKAKGACEESPQLCNELYQPVCGCDGVTYPNDCHAAMKGVSVASTGACPAPASPSDPRG